MSRPAQSRPWAMRDYPRARRREVEALLELARVAPGAVVVELQAADGYLSDRLRERLSGAVHCICVEPSPLHHRIAPWHTVCTDPLHDMRSLEAGRADYILGLAGLHHSEDPAGTLRESWRLLRPGGRLAICDVERASPMDHWLNRFVDRHHPGGHEGSFFGAGELAALLTDCGFEAVRVNPQEVPWRFASRQDLIRFCQGLFGLDCDPETVAQGIGRHLQVRDVPGGVELGWSLLYASGVRPSLSGGTRPAAGSAPG